jgi:alpha-N-arabinofuranosidase
MDAFIKSVAGICDYIKAKKHSKKQVYLSFDEWNVWYHSHVQDKQIEKWLPVRPILEDIYNMEDALVVGCMLITLLKNADRVKIACLAQLVNVIAPIMTETGGSAWRQTIFFPFMHASLYGRGTVLAGPVSSEKYDSKEYNDIPWLEAVSVLNDERNELTIFAVNRNLSESIDLEANLCDMQNPGLIEPSPRHNQDLTAVNSAAGEKVKPAILKGAKLEKSGAAGSIRNEYSGGTTSQLQARLPPASWNVIRIKIGG